MKKIRKLIILLALTVVIVSVCHIWGAFPKFASAAFHSVLASHASASDTTQKGNFDAAGISALNSTLADGSITLTHNNSRKTFDLSKYKGGKSKVFTHQEFTDRYQKGSYEDKKRLVRIITTQGWDAETAFRCVYGTLSDDIDKHLTYKIDVSPVDAQIKFNPRRTPMFSITPEKAGRKTNRERLYRDLLRSYLASPSASAAVKTTPVAAEVKAEDLHGTVFLRSRFSTSMGASTEERKHNVKFALSKFNGLTVKPGETVSFNKTVGARSEKNGFKTAKIILKGRFEDGVGGGVCQSSTTLYNAALLADMTIVRAIRHTLSVGYVQPSFDAMVNGGDGDMVFRNDSPAPIYIHAYSSGDDVIVEFYGAEMPYRIVRRSEVTEKISHGGYENIIDTDGKYSEHVTYRGEKYIANYPKDGLKSKGYLRYYRGDTLLREIQIRSDVYKPLNGLIVEGAKEKPIIEPENVPRTAEDENGNFYP